MTEETKRTIVRLLHDERFQRFMQQTPYDYDWVGSGAATLPDGVDAELAQELVSFARRMRGMPLLADIGATDRESLRRSAFWVVSPGMYADLFGIVTTSGVSSTLWKSLERTGTSPEVRALVSRDMNAALRRDGVDLPYERVSAAQHASA